MTTVNRAPVDAWLTSLVALTGFPVGSHKAPAAATYPYLVLWTVGGGELSGPALTAPDADVKLVYQVDAVGRTPEQARLLADLVRQRILGRSATGAFSSAVAFPAGVAVHDRISEGGSAGIIAEGSAPNEVYSVPARYALAVTPTA